ncbi:MAG: hypothetical protein WC959_02325 [Kiritimatiellales bacterium]
MKKLMITIATTIGFVSSILAETLISFIANGQDAGPTAQQWTWTLDGGTAAPSLYYTNEAVNGASYYSWAFDSVAGDKGSYLLQASAAKTSIMRQDGWTLTYISRTQDARSQGYHRLRFRDGDAYFDMHFVANSSTTNNGLYIAKSAAAGGGYQFIAFNFSDTYSTVQLTYEPVVAGSLNSNDVVKIWINGREVYAGSRAICAIGTTGIIRVEFGDAAIGGTGLFFVNQVILDSGIHVIPIPRFLNLYLLSSLSFSSNCYF